MNRLFAAVFSGLTAVAGYGTATNTGVIDSSYEKLQGPPSVRAGSARTGGSRTGSGLYGGGRRGK